MSSSDAKDAKIAELEAELVRARVREKIAEDRGRSEAFDYMAPHLLPMKDWARKQDEKVCKEFFCLLANGSATVFDHLKDHVQAYKNALERSEGELRKMKAESSFDECVHCGWLGYGGVFTVCPKCDAELSPIHPTVDDLLARYRSLKEMLVSSKREG